MLAQEHLERKNLNTERQQVLWKALLACKVAQKVASTDKYLHVK